jgi:lipid II:glycine glycyltransferase (peptidoglycan interpeptide bridge formation enzyme)
VEQGYRELALEGDVVLDLRPGAKFIFDHFPLNRRRDIRKAMRSGIEVSEANHRRFLARYKGEVIAACGVRFYPGGLVEYANNCSRDEFLRLCPNDLLVWRMIEWACENKFPALSMGGAHPFLRKWGTTVVPVHRYRLDRTFLHRVELREEAMAQIRQLIHRLPPPLQTTLKTLVRSRAA